MIKWEGEQGVFRIFMTCLGLGTLLVGSEAVLPMTTIFVPFQVQLVYKSGVNEIVFSGDAR